MKNKIFCVHFSHVAYGMLYYAPPVEPEVIYITKPLKDPLPHPTMPILEIPDGDITIEATMEHVLLLNGAILKLQLLIEIYEREDRKLPDGYGNKKFEGMTLEQLRIEYLKLLGISPTSLEGSPK